MFKFFFIKRHQKDVLKYIQSVFINIKTVGTEETGRRYAKPENISYSPFSDLRPAGTKRIQYSLKSTPSTPEALEDSEKSSTANGTNVQSDDSHIKYQKKPISSDVKYSVRDRFNPTLVSAAMQSYLREEAPTSPLSSATNLTFVQKLQYYLRIKNLIETDVYKAALMDRRLFSKIISNKDYKPSKDTALALIFALKLDINEAADLLERAGYTLSHSLKRDIIIEYFIKEKVYNLNNINAFLYNMDEKIIGRSV